MKSMSTQMELFEPVERGFDKGGTALKTVDTGDVFDFNSIASDYNESIGKDLLTGPEMAALFDVFLNMKQAAKTSGMNEGGLMDEGGSVDPVSGNDVPPGSTKEEVRDDIPAQLSEGEFVFPADVVRYIGLEKLMRMRQEAKMGLAQMEAMGQMGNSEEATMPDDLPFDMYDLDIEDDSEYNMAQGGVVKAANGTYATGTYKAPSTIGGFQPSSPVTTGYTGIPQAVQPFQPYQPQFSVATPQQGAFLPKTSIAPVLPTFSEFVGQNIPGVDFEYVEYVNESGQIIKLRKDKATGELLDPIPEGYSLKTEEVQTTATETPRVQTTQVRETGGGRDDEQGRPTGGVLSLGGKAVGTAKGIGIPGTRYAGPSRQVVNNTLFDVSFEIPGFTPNPLSMGNFMKNMLSKDGPGLPSDAYARIGVKGGTVTAHEVRIPATDYNKIRNDITGDLADTYRAAGELAEALENGTYNYNAETRTITDNNGNIVDHTNLPDDLAKGLDKLGESIYADVRDDTDKGDSMIEAGQNLSDSEKAALSMYNDQQFSDFFADSGKDDTAPSTPSAPDTYSDPYEGGYGSEPSGPDDTGSDPDDGSNPICLTENMKVKLNGVIDFVTNVKVGDIVDNTVVTEVLHKHMREGYYVVNDELEITNDHPVLANGSWKRTEDLVLGDYINNVEVTSLEYVEQVTPTVYIGTADDRYDVYTEGEVYTVHGQYKNITKQAA